MFASTESFPAADLAEFPGIAVDDLSDEFLARHQPAAANQAMTVNRTNVAVNQNLVNSSGISMPAKWQRV
jgi:hypothetical protein